MKKILASLLILVVSVMAFSNAQAQDEDDAAPAKAVPAKKSAQKAKKAFTRQYGIAGCGVGSIIVGKRGGQISAATTNGTSGNQTFGISSGTLNCVDNPSAEVAERMDQFILVNRSQIQGDVARGNGESISALANFMGCDSSSTEVGRTLKANYRSIFEKGAYTNEITDSIISTIKDSPKLANQCKQLG